MSYVSVQVIPMKFVKDIRYVSYDGRSAPKHVQLDRTEIVKTKQYNADADLDSFVRSLHIQGHVLDLQVNVDFNLIEEEVNSHVRNILTKYGRSNIIV